MRGKEVGMNKKLIIMLGVATVMAGGAFAYPHHGWHCGPHHGWGPRPHYYHHHYHGGYWGPGGRYFWPGFVGGVIGGAVASTIIDTSPTVVVQQPAVVTQPAVVAPSSFRNETSRSSICNNTSIFYHNQRTS